MSTYYLMGFRTNPEGKSFAFMTPHRGGVVTYSPDGFDLPCPKSLLQASNYKVHAWAERELRKMGKRLYRV